MKYKTEEERKEAKKEASKRWRIKKGISPRKIYKVEERGEMNNKRVKLWNMNHPERRKIHKDKWIESNPNYMENYRKIHKKYAKEYHKEYSKNNRDILREYHRKYQIIKLKTDINFKLSRYLRSRLRDAIKGNQKLGSAVKDLGCTIPFLKLYLESSFKPGMTWDNWTWNGWHMDHIKPLSKFNLQDREEFLKANHYTNLQPLWAEENMIKGNRME
jgi:hypothetical protein